MTSSAREIAQAFVSARRAATPVFSYPGDVPSDLATGYQIQEQAIGLWGGDIVGWKIGRIPPAHVERLQAERLAGPIFRSHLWRAESGATPFPIFDNGFAAVEAEYVYRLGADAPAGKTDWTEDEARALVAALHIGVELAGSPLATINKLGPTVVVSDFGNNHGLILGQEIPNWRERTDADLTAETFIDGKSVGRGGAETVLGGPLSSLVFLLEHLARRNRPLKAGQLISTGAATGIHDIAIGQNARVSFTGIGEIHCAGVKATAQDVGHAVA